MSKGGSNEIPETEEEKELARVAVDKWNDYTDNYVPAENEFIRRIEVTEQDREGLKGAVNAGVNVAFDGARKDVIERETNSGAKPGSGRFNQALERVLNKQGRSLGFGAVDAEQSMDVQRADGLNAAISIGRGKESDALQGMNDLANNAYDRARSDAENANTRRAGNIGAVGTVVGGVIRASGEDEG